MQYLSRMLYRANFSSRKHPEHVNVSIAYCSTL